MRSELPTGTVTFLFTDIEGSTRLLHSLGPGAYGEALAEHRHVLRGAFAAHGGVEVDTQGDAFFVSFPTAEGAASAALAANEALASSPISVRMGLHTGTPTLSGEGYVGVDVHRGARVAALAHGGQVLLSPTATALLQGAVLRDLGLHRLKDFDGGTRLSQLGEGTFPPLRTPGSVDLPTPATRFLGREAELFDAVSLVYERDPRVLTVLGPGGTGKTRFCLELCRLLAEEAEGGTVFCALAPLRDPELVLPAIAERLGAASAESGAIAARVGDKRTHLLCDNLEHLLPAVAHSLAQLAASAPELRLYVTSREPLRVQGETELDLPPLTEREAVSLFVERAHAVRPELEADAAVSELCTRLDNLPLALELAAARTKLLSPEALLARLGESLDLLKGTRDADERHKTLRATIAWSYELLDADEQRLFRRLSVFRGGATLASAEAACEADLDVLASLLDKSLVRRRTDRLVEQRFWMLETIREFAAAELEASGEAGEIGRRHAERMLEIALAAHLSEDDDEPFQLDLALAEREDLRAALDWATEHDAVLGLEIAVALETLWNAHAPVEGLRRLDELRRHSSRLTPELEARVLRVDGNTAALTGDLERCVSSWDASLALFRDLGDERGVAGILNRLFLPRIMRGQHDEARAVIEESQRLAEGRFVLIEATNLGALARLAAIRGDDEEAERLDRRSAELAHGLRWTWWESTQHCYLLLHALRRGHLDVAEREGRHALRIASEHEMRENAMYAIAVLARVAVARGDLRQAGTLWGAAAREADSLQEWARELRRWSGDLPETPGAAFVSASAAGRELDLWDAVAIALDEDEPQTVP